MLNFNDHAITCLAGTILMSVAMWVWLDWTGVIFTLGACLFFYQQFKTINGLIATSALMLFNQVKKDENKTENLHG